MTIRTGLDAETLWGYDEVDFITLVDEIQSQDKAVERERKRAQRRR